MLRYYRFPLSPSLIVSAYALAEGAAVAAAILPAGAVSKREWIYLVSCRRWSVTTSKHQSYLRRALPTSRNVIEVSDVHASPREALADFRRRYYAEVLRAERATRYADSAHVEARKILADAQRYAEALGVPRTRFQVATKAAERAARIADADARRTARIAKIRDTIRTAVYSVYGYGTDGAGQVDRILALPPKERTAELRTLAQAAEAVTLARLVYGRDSTECDAVQLGSIPDRIAALPALRAETERRDAIRAAGGGE